MRDLTVDLLNELFEYGKETGKLYWKVTRQRGNVGDEVGCDNGRGYLVTRINNKNYKVHRVIFLMHKGYLPKTLDHVNGDRADNRIENLRAVTRSQNQHNRKLNKNNTSGYKGVSFDARLKLWKASICLEGKRIHLGSYKTLEEADSVVRKAREELHGIFAHHGDCEPVIHENTEG